MSQEVLAHCIHPDYQLAAGLDSGFSVIGLDLELLVQALGQADAGSAANPNLDLPPPGFMRYLRSMDERYSCFKGNTEGVLKLLDSFQVNSQAEEKSSGHRGGARAQVIPDAI
jgi:hypothetical protein